jgi:hypothetical protein
MAVRQIVSAILTRLRRLKRERDLTPEQSVQAVVDWLREGAPAAKAGADDWLGRFREIVSDPMNLLIERHPMAGCKKNGYVVLHNGNIVPVDGPYAYYKRFSDILVINRGVHEPVEEYSFQQVIERLPENPTIIELGAYWAHYSMWLKKKRPKADVYLVEPDPHNLSVGRHNVRVNGQEAVFIQAAVGHGQFEVDRFVSERSIRRVDVLHMDVQGLEVEALAGATQCLSAKAVDYVFVSTHTKDLHRSVCDVLSTHGYRIEIESGVDVETTACDGLVFASSPAIAPVLSGLQPLGRLAITRARVGDLVRFVTKAWEIRSLS